MAETVTMRISARVAGRLQSRVTLGAFSALLSSVLSNRATMCRNRKSAISDTWNTEMGLIHSSTIADGMLTLSASGIAEESTSCAKEARQDNAERIEAQRTIPACEQLVLEGIL